MTDSAPMHDPKRTAPVTGTVALSTRDLASAESRTVWAETLDSTYCEMAVAWPRSGDGFAADIVARPLGEMSLSVVRADPHAVHRTPALIESDPSDDYILCLITRGTATIAQGDRTATLENGAFGLVDSSAPFIVNGLTAFEQVVLRLPRDQFAIRVAEQIADDAMGQSIAADAGIGRLTSTFLVDLANHGDDLTTTSLAAVSSAVLDVVAAAVNHGVESHTLTELAHAEDLREVQRVMMRYIADPERTIADAAAELGMSVRYVHKLFSTAGTTPRAWLYSRRFEKARTLLLQTDLSVAEVGFRLGFRDASHFSRAFSKHAGASPGRFRRAARSSR
ncbi:AraC family transcriptional regulator [Rhodococcus sp. NPDC003994]